MLRMQSVEELLRNEYSAVPTQLHATVRRWCLCAAESLACLSLEKIESHFEYTNALTPARSRPGPCRHRLSTTNMYLHSPGGGGRGQTEVPHDTGRTLTRRSCSARCCGMLLDCLPAPDTYRPYHRPIFLVSHARFASCLVRNASAPGAPTRISTPSASLSQT